MESRDAHGSHCEEQGWVCQWKHSLSRCRQPSLWLLGLSKSFSSSNEPQIFQIYKHLVAKVGPSVSNIHGILPSHPPYLYIPYLHHHGF
ncbi:hypothetical protein CK203_043463 [Vitis vinifera]|uniref:Uncharacterized protein n=1 Tax=Vitis vinifera TaxID=29760 RepID=A0A438HR91_VITVI|nr:hypothetical protein CK203_043463 [Vitis vinifera]